MLLQTKSREDSVMETIQLSGYKCVCFVCLLIVASSCSTLLPGQELLLLHTSPSCIRSLSTARDCLASHTKHSDANNGVQFHHRHSIQCVPHDALSQITHIVQSTWSCLQLLLDHVEFGCIAGAFTNYCCW
jgi:hypothetical protein